MAKFNKKKGGELPPISTASLPDIIFMLLFFFMTVTQMKTGTLMVENSNPVASQVHKLDKKEPVTYIYAGVPMKKYQAKFGKNPKLQVNDVLVDVKDIPSFILKYKDGLREAEQRSFTTALKIDKSTKMGLISDVKAELREINALKITYITREGDAIEAIK